MPIKYHQVSKEISIPGNICLYKPPTVSQTMGKFAFPWVAE